LIKREHILSIANGHLENSKVFVTGIKIGSDNHISLFLDGDEGVTISDCVALSRAVEGSLDRGKEDFSLDVSSHGATTPLVLPRQFPKHIGRQIEIKMQDGSKVEGTLVTCDNDTLKVEYSVRENKPVGKGKITIVKEQLVRFSDIKEAKIKLKY
jgi:ribosome maturation factor RimP